MRSAPLQRKKLKRYVEMYAKFFAVALAFLWFITPCGAFACDATGLFTLGGGTGKCTAGDGIFAGILCTFENTMSQVLSKMYCSFQTELKDPIATTLSFATVIFGVGVFTGMIRLSVKEAGATVIKFAMIWALAMNSDYGILWVGKFFMGVLQEGSDLAVSPMGGNVTLTQPDSVLKGFFNFMSNPNVADIATTNGCGGEDCMNTIMLKNFSSCAGFLMTVAVGLLVLMPVVIIFIMTVLMQYIGLYLKAVLGYLTSIVILTFLFILSPMFLSFYLFTVTRPLFGRWLQFLQSFSFQAIILFAFVAMLGLVTQGFTLFLYGLMGMLRPYDITMNVDIYKITIPNACSICEYYITTQDNGSQTIKCLPALAASPAPPSVITTTNFPAPTGNATTPFPNDVQGNPISYYPNLKDMRMDILSSQASATCPGPDPSCPHINDMPEDANQDKGINYVIPITRVIERADFVIYLVSNVIAFVIIASVFQEFIQKAPELARSLAGTDAGAGALGGKTATGEGVANSIKYLGADSFEAGMVGMERNMMREPFNANRTIATRLREGIIGRKIVPDNASAATIADAPLEGGLIGGFLYGADPNAGSAAYIEQENAIKAATVEVESANAELQDKQAIVVSTGNAASQAQKALAEELGKKPPNRAQVNQLRLNMALTMKEYEAAVEAADDRREILKRKREDLTDERAALNRRKSLHGVAALTDSRGNVITRGIADDLSLEDRRDDRSAAYALQVSRGQTLNAARTQKASERSEQDANKAKMRAAKAADAASSSKRNEMAAGTVDRNASNSSSDLIELNSTLQKRLETMDKQLSNYGKFISEEKRKEYQKVIDKAKLDVAKAKTAKDAQNVLKDLTPVQAAMDEYSSRNIMAGVAVAGLAGTAAYMAIASNTVSPAYLKQADKSISRLEDGVKGANSENAMDALVDEINKSPKMILNGVLNGLEGQTTMAARIVPQEELADTSDRLQATRKDAEKAKTPEEAGNLIRRVSNEPKTILAKIFDTMDARRNEAGQLVEEKHLTSYDKKMADAKTDADYAQKGEDFEKALKTLLTVPTELMHNVLGGLEEKVDDNASSVPEEVTQRNKQGIKNAKDEVNSSVTGDEFHNVFGNIKALAAKIDGRKAESEERPELVLARTQASIAGAQDKINDGSAKRAEYEQERKASQKSMFDVTWKNDSTLLGSTASEGFVKAAENVGNRLKKAVPDMSAIHMQNDSTILGSKASKGVGAALGDLEDKYKALAPDFSKTTVQNTSTLFGSDASRGIKPALKDYGDRVKNAFSVGGHEDKQPDTSYSKDYVAQWEALDDSKKWEGVQERLQTAKRHYDAASTMLAANDIDNYKKKLDAISERLAKADTGDDVREVVRELAILQTAYEPMVTKALQQRATQNIQALEKGLAVAPGVVAPETIRTIQLAVDSARNDMAYAQSAMQYDAILGKLRDAQKMLYG